MKKKLLISIPLIMVVIVLVIGFVEFRSDTIYQFKQNDDYILQLVASDDTELIETQNLSNCGDYGCYRGKVDYYKFNTNYDHADVYFAIVTMKTIPNNDHSKNVVDTFVTTEKLVISTDTNEALEEEDYSLVNYHFPNWNKKRTSNLTISINNFLGKKKLSDSINEVGYLHSGSSSIEGLYRGDFTYVDHVESETIKTYYIFEYPKENETIKNTINIQVKFKQRKPGFLFMKSTDTETIEDSYTTEFKNE